jgi:hypothetical protein
VSCRDIYTPTVRSEREAIVKWMRREARGWDGQSMGYCQIGRVLAAMARAIEDGAHVPPWETAHGRGGAVTHAAE